MDKFICNTCGNEFLVEERARKNVNRCKPCQNAKNKEYRARKKLIEQGEPVEVPAINMEVAKVAKDEKVKIPKVDLNEIKNIMSGALQMISGLVSTRAGEHWQITKDEGDSVAEPLTKILNKYDSFKNVGKHMDGINLVIAVGAITIPRIMMQYKLMTKDKEEQENARKSEPNTINSNIEKTSNEVSNERDNSADDPTIASIHETNDFSSIQSSIL